MNKLIVPISAGVSAILCAGVVTAFARGQDGAAPGQVLQPITAQQQPSGSSTVPASGTPPAPETVSPSATSSATNSPAQSLTYSAGDAGTATFRAEGRTVTLEDVTTNSGWTYRIDDQERDEVELDFINGTTRLRMNAEIDDGELRVRLLDRSNGGDDDDDDDDDRRSGDDDSDSDDRWDDDDDDDDDDWDDD